MTDAMFHPASPPGGKLKAPAIAIRPVVRRLTMAGRRPLPVISSNDLNPRRSGEGREKGQRLISTSHTRGLVQARRNGLDDFDDFAMGELHILQRPLAACI